MPVLFVRCLMIGSHVSVVDGATSVEVMLWSRGRWGVFLVEDVELGPRLCGMVCCV